MKRLIVVLAVILTCAHCHPVAKRYRRQVTLPDAKLDPELPWTGRDVYRGRTVKDRNDSNITPDVAVKFMEQFGYLGTGASNSEALLTEEAVTEAIQNVQKFGGLPETGELNEETMKLFSSPRCGNKDVEEKTRQKRYIIGSKGWRKRTITYHLANWTPKLRDESFVLSQLQRAFSLWSDYTGLKFERSSDYYNADMTIAFGRGYHGDDYPFDGPGFILAHAYYPYEFEQYGGDIHFDEDEGWKQDAKGSNAYDEVDFFTVAVHEIGHALGLAHSPVRDSIMFPYYKGPSENFALGYDDILAMYELYIQRQSELEENEPSRNSTSTSRPISTTTTTTTTTTRTTTTVAPDFDYSNDAPESTTRTYVGDYDTVDEHMKKRQGVVPNVCEGGFDAAAHLRGELFIFKGEYMWRLTTRGHVRPGYPTKFRQMFHGFPDEVKNIDAVYERPDSNLVFFSGSSYWVFDGNTFVDGSPRSISDLGVSVPKIDAAFVWGKNDMTYLFSGNQYWKFNERTRRVESGYPQTMDKWRGVPENIDAVFTWTDGQTYFFKRKDFWRFNDAEVITDQGFPKSAPTFWVGCN